MNLEKNLRINSQQIENPQLAAALKFEQNMAKIYVICIEHCMKRNPFNCIKRK